MNEEIRHTLMKRLDRIERSVYRIEDNSLANHFLALLHIVERILIEESKRENTTV